MLVQADFFAGVFLVRDAAAAFAAGSLAGAIHRMLSRACAFRVALEFNEDIKSIGCYTPRRLGVGHRADIDAIIESGGQLCAEFAAAVWPMRIGDDLEARLVMALEEFGHQKRRRVAAEIGRWIAYSEFPRAHKIFPPVLDRGGRETRRERAGHVPLPGRA